MKHKSIADRKRILKDSCQRCLKIGHKTDECRGSKECVFSRRKNVHHRSLCPIKFASGSQNKRNDISNVSEEITNESNNGRNHENVLFSPSEVVYMQLATTQAKAPSSERSTEVRLLLDSGSQRTYATEHMAEQLGLKKGIAQEIKLVTFGSNKPKVIQTSSTQLQLKLKNGENLTISANIVQEITGTVKRKAVDFSHSVEIQHILDNVDLADTKPTQNEYSSVDILIGNDFYLDIVLAQRI